MTTDLDRLLDRLRDQPVDHRLDQLEPSVWARINPDRAAGPGGAWGWRAALAAAMLVTGAFISSVAVAKPAQEISPFAIHSSLAPSTLLEGRL